MSIIRLVIRLVAKRIAVLIYSLRFYSLSSPNFTETLLDRMETKVNGTQN